MSQNLYPQLGQFFSGYFPQHWESLYKWDNQEPDYRQIIDLFIQEASDSILQQTIKELEHLISQNYNEDELHKLLSFTLGLSIFVSALSMTYRAWLEALHEVLTNTVKNEG